MVAAWKHDDRSGADQPVDLLTPVLDASYVVFDTELTGLKPKKDSIVSIGAVRMRGRTLSVGDTFYRLVEPRTTLTGKSVVVHGITPTEAAEWPGIDALLPEFLAFCRGAVLVGHVVSIDLAFLNSDMKRLYGAPLANPAVDTFAVYRWLSSRERNVCAYYDGSAEDNASLFQLAKYYGIEAGEAHNALSDAYVTAQLFQRFLGRLAEQGITTLRDLVRIGRP